MGTIEDIGTSIKLGLSHPMGPFQLADLIGLDTVFAIQILPHAGLLVLFGLGFTAFAIARMQRMNRG